MVEGIVTGTEPYGVFIKWNAVNGLLHKSRLPAKQRRDVARYYHQGDRVSVKAAHFEQEKGRVEWALGPGQ